MCSYGLLQMALLVAIVSVSKNSGDSVQGTRTYSHAYSYIELYTDALAYAYACVPAFLSRCHAL